MSVDTYQPLIYITTEVNNITTSGKVQDGGDGTYYLSLAREETIKTVYMCISMFGIPANFLSLIAIMTSPKMRAKPFNILIVHQSFADLCACACAFAVQLLHPSYDGVVGKINSKQQTALSLKLCHMIKLKSCEFKTSIQNFIQLQNCCTVMVSKHKR